MAPTTTKTKIVAASAAVPFIYRIILTVIEPFFAISGALLVFRKPAEYLSVMSRHQLTFSEDTTFLYTASGGSWLYFAFVELVIFRLFDDLRLWRLLSLGMLLSDVAYCHSAAQAVGGWKAWSDFGAWTTEDHTVFWSTVPMVLTRILLVFGIGIGSATKTKAN